MNILQTRGLSKSFGGLVANDDINFDLKTGKITALIGPNGAGKSTFVGMICGRIESSSGSVLFEGEDISHLPAHKRIRLGIAYTFQITSIFPGLSVEKNIELAARRSSTNTTGVSIADRVSDALGKIGLTSQRDKLAENLSYGHKRILEIAMGLVQEPKLFILDEPTQGLSEQEIEDFVSLIKSLAGETTILLIEHNMDVVMKTADEIAVLDYGELIALGMPDEIRANELVQAAYLGTGSDA